MTPRSSQYFVVKIVILSSVLELYLKDVLSWQSSDDKDEVGGAVDRQGGKCIETWEIKVRVTHFLSYLGR